MGEDVAAELAVRNAVAKIAHATDGGDLDSYAALIHPDARWVMPMGDPVVGRAAIVAAARARRESGTTGPGTGTRHVITTTWVEVNGDTAWSGSYWQFLADTAGTPVIRMSGVYQDTLRRVGGDWLFAERISSVG